MIKQTSLQLQHGLVVVVYQQQLDYLEVVEHKLILLRLQVSLQKQKHIFIMDHRGVVFLIYPLVDMVWEEQARAPLV